MNIFSDRKWIQGCGILFLLIGAVYSNAFHPDFLLDDYVHLIGSGNLESIGFFDLFTKDFGGFFRPMGFVFLKVVLEIFGLNPLAYYLLNLGLFYIVCVLFYYLLRECTRREDVSLLTVILFAVHPINAFLINYKTAGNNTIFVIFMLIATIFFWKYLQDQKKRHWYGLSLLFYFISLLAHEMAFMLPVYLFLIYHFFRDERLRKKIGLLLPYLGVFLIYYLLRQHVLIEDKGAQMFLADVGILSRLATYMKLLMWYFSKLLWPVNILFLWDEQILGRTGAWNVLWFLGVGLTFWIWKNCKKEVTFGWLLFLAGLAPGVMASFVYTVRIKTALIEPHWFTFSSTGFFLILSYGLIALKEKINKPQIGYGLMIGFIILLGILTRTHNHIWKDDRTYCAYWLEKNALNGTPWHHLAKDYRKDWDKGLNPDQYKTCDDICRVAITYHITNQAQTTLDYYLMAEQKQKPCVCAVYGAAVLFADLENMQQQAEQLWQQGRQMAPELEPVYQHWLKVFEYRGHKTSFLELKSYWPGPTEE